MPTATVLGARNLGGAIVDHLLAEGWAAAAVAQSEDTLERVREAGAQATQALVQAAAQELRGEGIHVALLIVDASIESPKTEAFTRDTPREALADQVDVARAVAYLAGQSPRALTHELQLTPSGERWVP